MIERNNCNHQGCNCNDNWRVLWTGLVVGMLVWYGGIYSLFWFITLATAAGVIAALVFFMFRFLWRGIRALWIEVAKWMTIERRIRCRGALRVATGLFWLFVLILFTGMTFWPDNTLAILKQAGAL